MTGLLRSMPVGADNFEAVALRVRRDDSHSEAEAKTKEVIEGVRRRGDAALTQYTKRFDGADVDARHLRVSQAEIEGAMRRVDPEILSALRFSLKRQQAVQERILKGIEQRQDLGGITLTAKVWPIPSVGCYVPGGRASYPSSVVMTVGLAKLAGVERVVVCTPPGADGRVRNETLAAASICGADEVYKVGGAQAVAAMAYGTRTIGKVAKIVGPGGLYVAMAKKLVSPDTPIDFFAGPTEILVVADETTDPGFAAWDLVAQAEHGGDSACWLVTTSEEVADRVRSELKRIVKDADRKSYLEASLARGFAAVCPDRATAISFVRAMAPEHLEIMVSDPDDYISKMDSAGLTLVGPYAPCAASDYLIGTNHVLPTGGYAKAKGGLSVLDFVRLSWTVEGSPSGLRPLLSPLRALATTEGLVNHYLSVRSRFEVT